MNKSFSLYLDGLRALAALVVVFSHFGYPRFTDGRYLWVRELNLGSDAVVIFFVLSGLVITFSAHYKDNTMASFAFARITRLGSVALPALLLGFLLDRAGSTLYPEFYASIFYNPVGFWEQIVRGLTFSNEWAGFATRLGTNGPYWSLSYEAAYYALFAVSFYMRSWIRPLLLVVLVAIFGLNIILLLPCWLLGIWVFARIRSGKMLPKPMAVVVSVGPVGVYAFALAVGTPDVLEAISINLTSTDTVRSLRFSDEFIWNTVTAGLTALHLLGMNSILTDRVSSNSRLEGIIKPLAASSFSIYLVHYPALQFLKPVIETRLTNIASDLVLLGTTLLICFTFAAIFERTLRRQRALLLYFAGVTAKIGRTQ